jgi:hypothetical protein
VQRAVGDGPGQEGLGQQVSSDLEDAFDLDRDAEGQRRRRDGRAGMPPGIAQRLDQEIGGAVDHLGLVGEIGGGVDEAGQLDDPFQPVEIAAAGGLDLRQQADRADPRRGGAVGDSMSSPSLPVISPSAPWRSGRRRKALSPTCTIGGT